MANQNDRFIDEVTEDLRRDRLFMLMRRFGWIVVLLIVLLVAAAGWREYAGNRAETKARAFGDALLAAGAQGDAEAEVAALAAVDPLDSGRRAMVRDLLVAGAEVEAGLSSAAGQRLAAAAGAMDDDEVVMTHLASLKSILAQGETMDAPARDAALTTLSAPGAPFELLALELKAVALIDAGRPDDAVALIRQIQIKDGLTETMRRRLSEMLITLGVDPEPEADLPGNVAASLPAG